MIILGGSILIHVKEHMTDHCYMKKGMPQDYFCTIFVLELYTIIPFLN